MASVQWIWAHGELEYEQQGQIQSKGACILGTCMVLFNIKLLLDIIINL
jgi:hypothetical protein